MEHILSKPVQCFYGTDFSGSASVKRLAKRTCPNGFTPYRVKSLLSSPSSVWKVFPRQAEALEFARLKNDGLMCFAFEADEKGRSFLVAHPVVFWHYDCQKPQEKRCTYEVIPELTACKLYFDLEFDATCNNVDGGLMTRNFISVVKFFIAEKWGINVEDKNIISLDSTTASKFSKHLIFDLPDVCFLNNYHVGNFVRYVCDEIRGAISQKGLHGVWSKSSFSIDDLTLFLIYDSKGVQKLFCDESVYSKNRHFRLYRSTKKGKAAPLLLDVDEAKDQELDFFLRSLITYLAKDSETLRILEFSFSRDKSVSKGIPRPCSSLKTDSVDAGTPYTYVDKFISSLVSPGKIYRSCYFPTTECLHYDIVGNRFCGNIGRQHRSNNVKYIVNLADFSYYQKCHDPDCWGYKSDPKPLPFEITFKLSDEADELLSKTNLLDNGVLMSSYCDDKGEQNASGCFNFHNGQCSSRKSKFEKFPSFGLSDVEMSSLVPD